MNTTTTRRAFTMPLVQVSQPVASLKIDHRGTYLALKAVEVIKKITASLPF